MRLPVHLQPASQPLQEQAAVQPAVDFTPYRDAIVRHPTVLQLDVFQPAAQDALRTPEGMAIQAVDFGNLGEVSFPGFDPGPPAVTDYR